MSEETAVQLDLASFLDLCCAGTVQDSSATVVTEAAVVPVEVMPAEDLIYPASVPEEPRAAEETCAETATVPVPPAPASASSVPKVTAKAKAKTTPKKAAPPKPAILIKTEGLPTLKEVLETLGFDGLLNTSYMYHRSPSDYYYLDNKGYANLCDSFDIENPVRVTRLSRHERKWWSEFTVLYLDDAMNVWYSNFTLPNPIFPEDIWGHRSPSDHVATAGFKMTKWRLGNGKIYPDGPSFVQSESEIREIAERVSPWGVKFCDDEDDDKVIPLEKFVCAPQIEQLLKCGYKFPASNFKSEYAFEPIFCDDFNRLTQLGHSPKEIFKLRERIARELKDEEDIAVYDVIRRLDKVREIDPDVAKDIAEMHCRKDRGLIEQICDLLKAKSVLTGQPIFADFKSLSAYLERLNLYEALEPAQSIPILFDYLASCRQCNVEPRFGDSLKREHDVMARTARNLANENYLKGSDAAAFEKACKNMAKYDYEEDVFFIRGVRDYQDLISEAQGQHNCLAAYRDFIINHKKMIFLMRAKGNPDSSLITVELSMDGKRIVQKSRKYNQPIRNKAQTDFLNRWLAHCRAL